MSDEPWPATDDFWLPLVDEPIGDIAAGIETAHPELGDVLDSPQKLLAFRTFAYIRVGLVLGRALMERENGGGHGDETWVEALAREPAVREELEREVVQVAEEVAAEFQDDESAGPDDAARSRFRAFAKRTLDDG
ncbi:MAG TPA: hypothetical protein VFL41_09820 [Gaiellaceae bacterium]|nr:hypothetical protein [Gaiellaceae bacterium]